MEAIPKKKGAKKGGSSFFYTDGPRSPFFFKAILQKIEGSPFFSFFFVDCVFRVFDSRVSERKDQDWPFGGSQKGGFQKGGFQKGGFGGCFP